MDEVTDEPLYRDRVCGIDIGKAGMVATIRVPSDGDPAPRAAGRDIMDHLIAGERSPKVLAGLARTAARRKIPQLEQALEGTGFFTDAHAGLLKTMLARIDRASADIEQVSAVIEALPATGW